KCVASCEAEFVAGSAAAQEVKWLRTLIQPIDPHVVVQPTELMIDNTGAAELASDNKVSKRLKHIDIWYNHLRWCTAEGSISICRIGTSENPADVFTKPSDKIKFAKFREMVGLRPA
ncbi:MAG: hypothetical protein BJ554DRAFT_555, partial [Olpidium bornovanus]